MSETPFSDRVDKHALLRYADFCCQLSDLINAYADLGSGAIYRTLRYKAEELAAIEGLPGRAYSAPTPNPQCQEAGE